MCIFQLQDLSRWTRHILSAQWPHVASGYHIEKCKSRQFQLAFWLASDIVQPKQEFVGSVKPAEVQGTKIQLGTQERIEHGSRSFPGLFLLYSCIVSSGSLCKAGHMAPSSSPGSLSIEGYFHVSHLQGQVSSVSSPWSQERHTYCFAYLAKYSNQTPLFYWRTAVFQVQTNSGGNENLQQHFLRTGIGMPSRLTYQCATFLQKL